MIDLFVVVSVGGLLQFKQISHEFEWQELCNAALMQISEGSWSGQVEYELTYGQHQVSCRVVGSVIMIVSLNGFSLVLNSLGCDSKNDSCSVDW